MQENSILIFYFSFMKKIIALIFLFTAILLTTELTLSPLMHNHSDLRKHDDCPAYILNSNQQSININLFVNLTPEIKFFEIAVIVYSTVKFNSSFVHSINNKSPPTV